MVRAIRGTNGRLGRDKPLGLIVVAQHTGFDTQTYWAPLLVLNLDGIQKDRLRKIVAMESISEPALFPCWVTPVVHQVGAKLPPFQGEIPTLALGRDLGFDECA